MVYDLTEAHVSNLLSVSRIGDISRSYGNHSSVTR